MSIVQYRHYIESYLPIYQLMRMYNANKKGFFVYRHIALSWDDAYWHDTAQNINGESAFRELIYSKLPKQIHFSRFRYSYEENKKSLIEEKELAFDIDITDFERYCLCGTEKKVCPVCWLHIEGSAFILRYLLLNILSIEEKYLLWVFSGKKGFHCIVNEPNYMKLTEEGRTSLYQVLSIENDNEMNHFIQSMNQDFLLELEELFYKRAILLRNLLVFDKFQSKCLKWIELHFKQIHSIVSESWLNTNKTMDSRTKWISLREIETQFLSHYNGLKPTQWITIKCYYPVIDPGPLGLNRTFKIPFSIHSETKKIALPVDYKELLCDYQLPGYTLMQLMDKKNLNSQKTYFTAVDRFSSWINQYAQ